MNLLFVADPLETFKTYKDSTYAMMVEAARRGHGLHAMRAEDLAWRGGRVQGRVQAIELTGGAPWFRRGESVWRDLADFDAVLMRKDPPFDQGYLTATWLLEMAERDGARVFNRRPRCAITTRSWRSRASRASPRQPWSAATRP